MHKICWSHYYFYALVLAAIPSPFSLFRPAFCLFCFSHSLTSRMGTTENIPFTEMTLWFSGEPHKGGWVNSVSHYFRRCPLMVRLTDHNCNHIVAYVTVKLFWLSPRTQVTI